MCGVACIISKKTRSERESSIIKVLDGLEHRGRDNRGIYSNDFEKGYGITLGHQRLSILDLDPRSNQPFHSDKREVTIAFNGEIYNYIKIKKDLRDAGYIFKTNSDTEVIVKGFEHYGKEIFNLIEGMFSILLLSKKEQRLYIARDTFGVKPLFYMRHNDQLFISSESNALSQTSNKPFQLDRLKSLIAFGYNVGVSSIYENIFQHEPGIITEINLKDLSFNKSSIKKVKLNLDKTISIHHQVDEILTESIVSQSIADVPIGVFLSGGIDSGLIASKLARANKDFSIFTAGDSNNNKADAFRAKILADKLNKKIFNIDVHKDNFIDIFTNTYSKLSEPILDSALIYSNILSKAASVNGTKVVFSGGGGDELFFGYERYLPNSSFKRKLASLLSYKIKSYLSNFIKNDLNKNRMRYLPIDFAAQIAGCANSIGEIPQSYIDNEEFKDLNETMIFQKDPQNFFDIKIYLKENILHGFDQTTMNHTIEGRVPFLDRQLLEISTLIPKSEHIKNNKLKSILKKIANTYLPDEYLNAPKQGFSGPVTKWVEEHYEFFEFNSKNCASEIFGKNSKIYKLVSDRRASHYDLFNLSIANIWIKNNK